MSFAFPQVDPETSGQVANMQVPLSRYLEASFDYGAHDTVLNSLARMREVSMADADPTSPVLDPTIANERWGVGDLRFDKPVREATARVLNQRKRDEMDRQFFLSQGSTGMRWLPGFAAGMLGSISNPVDLALMFVPFVGEEKLALSATTTVGKMFARRLVTREALQATFPRAPGLAEAMINGMVGQTMFEVPNLIASAQDHADYGIREAAFNVGAGGAFSATIHGAVRLWQVRRAAKLLKDLDRGTRDAMAKDALNSFLRDEHVDPAKYVHLDDRAIFEAAKFDADVARSAAYKNIDLEQLAKAVREKYGEKVGKPAVRLDDGTILVGESHDQVWGDLEKSKGVTKEHLDQENRFQGTNDPDHEGFVTDKGRFVSRTEAGKLVGLPDEGYNHTLWENDKLMSEQVSSANPEQLGAAEFDRFQQLMEENPQLSKADALEVIRDERQARRDRYLMENPAILELVERERLANTDAYIEKMRQEHDQFGEFGRLRRQEIDRQLAQGKMMPPDQVLAHQHLENFDGSSDAKIDEQITDLKEELKLDEAKEGAKAEKGGIEGLITKVDEMIKSLSKSSNKLFTGVTGLEPLIAMVGKEVAKGLLIAVREGLKLTKDLAKAIDHAMEWYRARGKGGKNEFLKKPEEYVEGERILIPGMEDTASTESEMGRIVGIDKMKRAGGEIEYMFIVEIESQHLEPGDDGLREFSYDQLKQEMDPESQVHIALERVISEEVESPDFTYTIQAELAKPQPFNVKPERFTADVIRAKLKQLPKPEQAMLKMAGIEEWLKQGGRQELFTLLRSGNLHEEFKRAIKVSTTGSMDEGLARFRSINEPIIEKIQKLGFTEDEALWITQASRGSEKLITTVKELITAVKAVREWRLEQYSPKGSIQVEGLTDRGVIPDSEIDYFRSVDSLLKKLGSEVVDREAFSKFVDSAMIETEIRPMLNVAEVDDMMNREYLRLQHELETAGYKFSLHDGTVKAPDKATAEMKKMLKQFKQIGKQLMDKETQHVQGETLVGDYVSQNVSVPIAFDKMEKPRTIFLAADQDVHVGSSHYDDVFPKKKGRHKNMLAWAETHVVTLPDGRRVLHVFELQSDVRQSFYAEALSYEGELIDKNEFSAHWLDEKGQEKGKGNFTSQKEAQAFADQKLKEYQEKVQPLIDHTDEILMKALVKLAKRKRLDGVVISDKRTALLTQGHLGEMGMEQKLDDVTGIEEDAHTTYEPPSQAAGMSQAYGQKLPSIMRKITGQAGEAVEMGGRHFLLDTGAPEIVGNMAGTKEPEIVGFNKAFPGSDAPSGTFFPVEKVSAEKPYQVFKPEQVEVPKPQVDAINAAVECLLKRMM